MGGTWGYEPVTEPEGFFPGQGCTPGFLKTLAMEWPEVRVKAVDLSLQETVSNLADHLLAELEADDRLVEIGYRGPQRLFLGVSESPLEGRDETQLRIEESWVILVTGGARGITAKVAREIARALQAYPDPGRAIRSSAGGRVSGHGPFDRGRGVERRPHRPNEEGRKGLSPGRGGGRLPVSPEGERDPRQPCGPSGNRGPGGISPGGRARRGPVRRAYRRPLPHLRPHRRRHSRGRQGHRRQTVRREDMGLL